MYYYQGVTLEKVIEQKSDSAQAVAVKNEEIQ